MTDNGVCWGILVVLSGLLAATVRNGWLLSIVVKQAAQLLASELQQLEAFRCRAVYVPKTEVPPPVPPSPPLS